MKFIPNNNKSTIHREFLTEIYNSRDLNFSIHDLINKFIEDHKTLSDYISIIMQIKQSDFSYFTVGVRYPLCIKEIDSINSYIDYVEKRFKELDEQYEQTDEQYHQKTHLQYLINWCSLTENEYLDRVESLKRIDQQRETILETPLSLPLNLDYESWGSSSHLDMDNNTIISDIYNSDLNNTIKVKYLDIKNRIVDLMSNGRSYRTFKDRILNAFEFIRSIDNKKYYIRNNKVYFMFERLLAKNFISNLNKSKQRKFSAITMDIETYTDKNNDMQIYSISIFDGNKSYSFYITDYVNLEKMLDAVFNKLFVKEHENKFIYIHNSSNFDWQFLLKPLLNVKYIKIDPTLKDNKMVNIKVRFTKNGIEREVNFRDSLLLLPSSLSKLGMSFNVETQKDIFPYNFVNENNLDYIGPVPAYEYFDTKKVSLDNYISYCSRFNNNWSIKDETIKYCEKDCVSLYEILNAFSIKIFQLFKINIDDCPTLPSLAFRIYRTSFIPKGIKIPVLENKVFKDIDSSYYGGHVDMYIPKNFEKEDIYHYDVNSLYPSVMKNFKYPINLVGYFKGNILEIDEYLKLLSNQDNINDFSNTKNKTQLKRPSYTGFFKVEITSPKNILHPIIPLRINQRSIFPEGTWTGWYYLEELNNAQKIGYQYKVLEGYIFQTENIFSNYVDKLSAMKENSPKNSAEYVISKLLMNSLYGKFGMKPIPINNSYVEANALQKFYHVVGFDNIISVQSFGLKSLVTYYQTLPSKTMKINVAISSAVTAYSRIAMSVFKNNPNYRLFYTDTDSIFIDRPLDPSLVDPKKLGLMKLEGVLTRFIALGAKLYGGTYSNNNSFTKVKGFKKAPTLDQLESLLNKNNSVLTLQQDKWFGRQDEATIKVRSTPYKIRVLNSKRNLIYENNILVNTSNKIIYPTDKIMSSKK